MTTEGSHRAYILRVLEKTGLTQTQLANHAGLDPSTLSRFLSVEREGHSLRPSTLRKIAAATGVPVESMKPEPPSAGFSEPEATPFDVEPASPLERIIAVWASEGSNVDPWILKGKALEGAGYRTGDILLVSLGIPPAAGDVVCAQVYDWAKGQAETIFRIFQPPFLVAATADPRLMKPHLIDDGKTAIKGVVIQSIRERGALHL